jgi:adenylate cyclase
VKAVHCAIAIRAWTEAHRQIPRAAALGLGRTRIGVETRDTIVGDVRHPDKARLHSVWRIPRRASKRPTRNSGRRSASVRRQRRAVRQTCCTQRAPIQLRGSTEAVHTYEPRPPTQARPVGLVVTVAPKVTPSNSHIIIAVPRTALSLSMLSIYAI